MEQLSQEHISHIKRFITGLQEQLTPVGNFLNESFLGNLVRGEGAFYVFHTSDFAGNLEYYPPGPSGVRISCFYYSSVPSNIFPDAPVQELRKIAADEGVEIYEVSPELLNHQIRLGYEEVPMFPENKPSLTLDDFLKMVWRTSRAASLARQVEQRYSSQIQMFYNEPDETSATDL